MARPPSKKCSMLILGVFFLGLGLFLLSPKVETDRDLNADQLDSQSNENVVFKGSSEPDDDDHNDDDDDDQNVISDKDNDDEEDFEDDQKLNTVDIGEENNYQEEQIEKSIGEEDDYQDEQIERTIGEEEVELDFDDDDEEEMEDDDLDFLRDDDENTDEEAMEDPDLDYDLLPTTTEAADREPVATTPDPFAKRGKGRNRDDDDEEEEADPSKRMNVLLIMTDDMRPQLGSYKGEDFPQPYRYTKMFTPNLDRLASESLLLKRAYVQYSLCGPSRTSMLTSRRPDVTRIFGNNNYWRVTGGNFTTLPQYFKEHGYKTMGLGKIFHKGKSSKKNDPISWTEKYYMPPYTDNHYLPKGDEGAGWRAITAKEREKVPLSDEYSVIRAKDYLRKLAPNAIKGKENFFMALGFKKPHLSLVCPEEFFHLYPMEKNETYLPDREWQTPALKSTVAMGDDTADLESTNLKLLPDQALRHLRRAYSACVSFVDNMVGKVLDELEVLGLRNNTIVTFVADHGYHLGENNHWGKVTNYERATHVPMMIRIPGKTDHGVETRSMVEAVDLYPTLVEAAGVKKIPRCPNQSSKIKACTDGKSMMKLIENPEYKHKKIVYSQIASGGQFMSYTIRTDRYRFMEWAEVKKKQRPDGLWDLYMDWELSRWPWWTGFFDRKYDPEERFNVTGLPKYQKIETALRTRMHQFVDRLYDHPKYFVKGH